MPIFPMDSPKVTGDSQLLVVGIERLRKGRYQPRRDFPAERIQELAESIRSQGVGNPSLCDHWRTAISRSSPANVDGVQYNRLDTGKCL